MTVVEYNDLVECLYIGHNVVFLLNGHKIF